MWMPPLKLALLASIASTTSKTAAAARRNCTSVRSRCHRRRRVGERQVDPLFPSTIFTSSTVEPSRSSSPCRVAISLNPGPAVMNWRRTTRPTTPKATQMKGPRTRRLRTFMRCQVIAPLLSPARMFAGRGLRRTRVDEPQSCTCGRTAAVKCDFAGHQPHCSQLLSAAIDARASGCRHPEATRQSACALLSRLRAPEYASACNFAARKARAGRLLVDVRGEDADRPQVAVALGVVEAVADDERVGDLEPDVVGVDLDLGGLGLAQQGADLEGCRSPALEVGAQPREGEPESTMSSMISTLRPAMSVSRSFTMRTTPLDSVPAPYDEVAIQSISMSRRSSRARSAITMTAPRRTPTSSRSRPS